jgi:hypothetical protein
MTSEMGREHIGHIPNGIKTCSEPEKNLSNILTDVGSTLIKAVFLLVVAAIVKEIIATSKSNFRVNSFLTRWKLKLQSHANAEPSRELVFSGVRRDYRERPTIIGGWKHSPNLNESSVNKSIMTPLIVDTIATLKSNFEVNLSLIRRKLNLIGHANAELNTKLNREMCRAHIGYIHDRIKTCAEPERNFSFT